MSGVSPGNERGQPLTCDVFAVGFISLLDKSAVIKPGAKQGHPKQGTRKGCPYQIGVVGRDTPRGYPDLVVPGLGVRKSMKFNPDKHHRQSIRLKDYDYSRNGAYFVTLCTFDRACYFDQFPLLREIVENRWSEIQARYGNIWLDEYVIMPNHFHGIIVIDDSLPGLSPIFKPVLGSVLGSFK